MLDGFVCLFIQSWKRLSINSLGIEACFNSLMTAQYHTLTVKQPFKVLSMAGKQCAT